MSKITTQELLDLIEAVHRMNAVRLGHEVKTTTQNQEDDG
jgi:hypothetical protein